MANQPNILFIMSDDHARQRISAYAENEVETPGIDRIAKEGARFDHCYCTNSICAPSRAAILTGNYNHMNGVRTLFDRFDGRQNHVAKVMGAHGYQTAMIGKWHLGVEAPYLPTGFDHFEVLRGQGPYNDPEFITPEGSVFEKGYTTDIITAKTLDWLDHRDPDKPFLLFCHHKAPHRNWIPHPKYKEKYRDVVFKHPETYDDDYATRGPGADFAAMKLTEMMPSDYKVPIPEDATPEEAKDHIYQHYMRDYMGCISSVDDSVAAILDYLDAHDLAEDTIVMYTSDQGFYTGEHGWFDKRFMYEESQCMPLVMRYPGHIPAGSVVDGMVLNIDFAPLFLDYAGIPAETLNAQGRSFRALVEGDPEAEGYDAVYYRYWEYPSEHKVFPHLGVRTERYKLILFEDHSQGPASSHYWELYDLKEDPHELHNLYGEAGYEDVVHTLKETLDELRLRYHEHDPLYVRWVPED